MSLRFIDVSAIVDKNRDSLKRQVQDTLKKIFNTYVNIAFSGRKDSIVNLDLAQRALLHNCFEVMFGDTDMEFPTTRTRDFVDWTQNYCIERDIYFYTARSEYTELDMGKKFPGQYSYHPILELGSAEVYLYIYSQELPLNQAYKLGFSRVGCIMCPNSSEKHKCLTEPVDSYCERIIENSSKDLSGNNAQLFREAGGWKARLSSRELKFAEDERFECEENESYHCFIVTSFKPDWKVWHKTIGDLYESSDSGDEDIWKCHLKRISIKTILAKTQYCIQCKSYTVECSYRKISIQDGFIEILDSCARCHACLNMLT